MSFTPKELDYLAGQRLGRLATEQPGGTLQVSPVGFTYNATLGTIDISGYNMARSSKFRNVASNGKVAFVIDDLASVRPWRPRCVEVRGRGEAINDRTTGQVIRIHPERIISFGITETDNEAHSLTVNARNVNRP